MRTSIWLFVAWGGAAILMVLLPFLMGSWTGFSIAIILAALLIYLGFRKR